MEKNQRALISHLPKAIKPIRITFHEHIQHRASSKPPEKFQIPPPAL